MKQYKIGFLLGSLNGAGAEKTILTLAASLVESGHEADVYLLRNEGDYERPETIRFIEVPGSDEREKGLQLHKLTEEKSYDLFISSRAEYYPYVVSRQKFCSVHITPTAWITNPKWQFWKTWKKKIRLARKFRGKDLIALSQGIRNDLVHNLGCQPERVVVINNPFDFEQIRAAGDVSGPLPEGDYLIYVASFIERKRHADLLQAVSRLKDKSVKLVLLGKGGIEDDIRVLAEKLGLTDRVIFWGWDANPYRLIKHARVSLLASEAEGLPRVVVESLILGAPVVSTDCPSGPNEVLVGDLAEFLVPVGDSESMAVAIDKALRSYPEIPAEFMERFRNDRVALQYLQLIR